MKQVYSQLEKTIMIQPALATVNSNICSQMHLQIKTSSSESQGQEEAASTRIFRPMQPLQ